MQPVWFRRRFLLSSTRLRQFARGSTRRTRRRLSSARRRPAAPISLRPLALFQLRQELRVDLVRAVDRHGTGGNEAHLGDEGEEVGDAVVDVDLALLVEVPVLEQ